jgi:hypothetical protein
MSLKSMAPRRGQGGDLPPQENVAGKIVEFKVAAVGKPSPDDRVVVELLHDCFGGEKKAGDRVEVKMGPAKASNSKHARREIANLPRKFNAAEPVEVGGIVCFERSYLDKAGVVVSRFLKAMQNKPVGKENQVERSFAGWTAVLYSEQQGKEGRQNRQDGLVLAQDKSKLFKTLDELKAMVGQHLGQNQKFCGCVRAIAPNDPDGVHRAAAMIRNRVTQQGDQWVQVAAETTFAEWLERDFGKSLAAELANPSSEGMTFEFIPGVQIQVGQKSLPSTRRSEPGAENKPEIMLDDSVSYRIGKTERGGHRCGFAISNVTIKRIEEASDYWFLTYVRPTSALPALVELEDIVTAHLPPAMADQIMKKAVADARARADERSSHSAGAGSAAAEAAPDHEGEAERAWGV